MTEARRTLQLHLGKCIQDLDSLYDNTTDLSTKKTKMLIKTAQKLFDKAEQARVLGDEENAYVQFMKYLRIVAYLRNDPEYLRDKKYYNDMLGLNNPSRAMNTAEELKTSLIERYAKEQKSRRLSEMKEAEAAKQAMEENKKKIGDSNSAQHETTVKLPDADEVTIKSDQLYAIIKSNKFKVLILDTRPDQDFIESHINHPSCISVPEQIINPGCSANIISQKLPVQSQAIFAERGNFDLIVMLDWSSTSVIPGKTMYLLKTILLKWDVSVHYRRAPVALLGGYEEWLLRYPALATDPRVAPPGSRQRQDDMLGSIDYPSWSDVVPPTPQFSANKTKPGLPSVDRTSKAAALHMYEERARSMQVILEQQEAIADTSFNLELQRIEAEKDWQAVHTSGEVEQQAELRSAYELREQEILSQLMQYENKQYDMEQENQRLREQLEEYQRREKEELSLPHNAAKSPPASSNEDDLPDVRAALAEQLRAKRARIEEMEARRRMLDQRRGEMEQQRNRKLAMARRAKPKEKDDDGDTYMVSPSDSPGANGINRSQSSPNISKLSSDEEEVSQPSFDRSTKPAKLAADTRQRDFQPVWGQVGRGLTGLKNLGNTCYMNSIIQCLNNTAILVSYLCNGQYLQHINRSHSTRGQIAEELAAVVRALWSGQYRFIAIKDLRNEVGKHARSFRGCEQQDSHEFLTILMDWLHHDLTFTTKPLNKDGLPPSELAWQQYTLCKESLVLRLFHGQMKSSVRCVTCGAHSVTYDSYSNLSLELPPRANRCALQDCLNLYLNGETIPGWNCPNCKEKRDAVKKLDISRLPPVLVIHFKRFYVEYMSNAYKKKQTYIDFPLEDLDMRQFSLHCPGNPVYNLYAVSNHYGSMEGGHYTAYCKSSVYGKWYRYDDHLVTEIPASEVKSSAAYILFYTSCETKVT